ncbi:MAG: hypothetical protein N4A72_00715 [Bacteroidales bacterium]|jgi:hypothetical protein|nr:hypothetical protein [Bacteroidales bacterium]
MRIFDLFRVTGIIGIVLFALTVSSCEKEENQVVSQEKVQEPLSFSTTSSGSDSVFLHNRPPVGNPLYTPSNEAQCVAYAKGIMDGGTDYSPMFLFQKTKEVHSYYGCNDRQGFNQCLTILKYFGVCTEQTLPFSDFISDPTSPFYNCTGTIPQVALTEASNIVTPTLDFTFYNCGHENNAYIRTQLQNGKPVMAYIKPGDQFIFYRRGLFTGSTSWNYANNQIIPVTIVGFGRTSNTATNELYHGDASGTDYYLITPNWGTNWGIDGYMLLKATPGNTGYGPDMFPYIGYWTITN